MQRERFERWIEDYERAWRTPGTDVLAELFRVDASYSTLPYKDPYVGLEAIAAMWDAEREGPDEQFEMWSEIGGVAVRAAGALKGSGLDRAPPPLHGRGQVLTCRIAFRRRNVQDLTPCQRPITAVM